MNTFFLPPMLIFGIFIIIVFMILRAVIRAASSGDSPTRNSQPQVTTQLGEDGFWVLDCPANPEDVIYYHYWVQGARHSGQIAFQPDNEGRQFVYTGERPDQASIVRIGTEAVDDSPSVLPPVIGATSTLWQDDTPSPPPSHHSSSFPSAY
jgi:hypothetical protein